ncbi:MAG: preprotein translocase subunit SecG [Acholeplasmatales bacterium]|jgi:preprotein translocase subunit SecG|nr:preprotein translocase subunit SecG [Acholeplasmatales bacterium]
MNVFDWLSTICALLLVVSVLFQNSDDDIQDAFGGSKSELFKNKKSRGFELYVKVASALFGSLFVVFCVIANLLRTL